ncbi:MAG: terminase, partial [Aliifodinibius sp.]|nr:terminase [Fodinibius sp.]NIV14129.1 terminase [Fodinibius sp.]NIY27950.1 terminase [Fodinibius sp.]
IEWFTGTALSRLNNKVTDPIIVIQQRLHDKDLAGYLLETGKWVHLNIPAIAEEYQRI